MDSEWALEAFWSTGIHALAGFIDRSASCVLNQR
jgi:hypothetical protein